MGLDLELEVTEAQVVLGAKIAATLAVVGLAVGAILVLPGKLSDPPPAGPAVTTVSTVPGPGAAEPFAGWNPEIEAWGKELGWAPMADLSARWELPEPTPTP